MIILAAAAITRGCSTNMTGTSEAPEPTAAVKEAEVQIPAMTEQETEISVTKDDPGPDGSAPDKPVDEITLSGSGIHEECLDLIEDIIENDIKYGFTSAQLAIIKDGRLVYENAWGKIDRDSDIPATTDTMYDLASVTKVFGVNYALQKLVSDGVLSLDEKITDYLGDRFADDVIEIHYNEGDDPDLETQKEWKRSLCIKDLLMHQSGFPADPKYCNPHVDTEAQKPDSEKTNLLYAGNGSDSITRENTIEAICKTPLLYKPGTRTVYSDVDYMILGLIVEKAAGMDLDSYLKENFCRPMGLEHITYKPLENGFIPDDCAATELHGNTRDGAVWFEGIREYELQGEVHDEKAYYSMGGISGHAGLFSNAADLAKLAELMLTGRYEGEVFFSEDVIREFTAPKSEAATNWGLGWWRQGDKQRAKYFGPAAGAGTIGHEGWTGTLIMIDPDRKLVIAYLTNKLNTPVTDKISNPNMFDGNWYTAASLGFVPEIVYIGMDEETDVSADLLAEAVKLTDDAASAVSDDMPEDHPARLNLKSKQDILKELKEHDNQ